MRRNLLSLLTTTKQLQGRVETTDATALRREEHVVLVRVVRGGGGHVVMAAEARARLVQEGAVRVAEEICTVKNTKMKKYTVLFQLEAHHLIEARTFFFSMQNQARTRGRSVQNNRKFKL